VKTFFRATVLGLLVALFAAPALTTSASADPEKATNNPSAWCSAAPEKVAAAKARKLERKADKVSKAHQNGNTTAKAEAKAEKRAARAATRLAKATAKVQKVKERAANCKNAQPEPEPEPEPEP
jgi:hypothetical protein